MAMLTSARQTKRKIVISHLHASAHNLLYGGGCSSSRVCACVCEGVSVSVSCRNCHNLLYGGVSKLETLVSGDVNFRSTNEVEVLIMAGSVADARVVEYVSVSVSVSLSVSVSVSKLEILPHVDVDVRSTNEA